MNPTALRIQLLRLVYTRGGYAISGIAHELCPRNSSKGWSNQAATRWGYGFIAPMLKAGVIEKFDDGTMVRITDIGYQYMHTHIDQEASL